MIKYEDLNELNNFLSQKFIRAVKKFLEKDFFILGRNVELFENEFAVYCGTKYAVGLNSGLDALILCLLSLDLPEKSEILVSSNSYIAGILAIIRAGHIPVLVEPKIETYNIDPNKIEKKINDKTRAILLVHLYGNLCEMDKILDISKKHNLKIIEDAAQAHGAEYRGKKAGNFGDVNAFSFYPTKNLGALGDAGAITTNSNKIYKKIKMLRSYGFEKKDFSNYIGYNSRLDELQAIFLRLKLKYLDKINRHKRKLARIYDEMLSDVFKKPLSRKEYYDVYHIYPIRHKRRDKLKNYLLKNGVQTAIHYPLAPHKQKSLKSFFKNEKYPISDEIHRTELSLPISYINTEKEIKKIIEIANKFI